MQRSLAHGHVCRSVCVDRCRTSAPTTLPKLTTPHVRHLAGGKPYLRHLGIALAGSQEQRRRRPLGPSAWSFCLYLESLRACRRLMPRRMPTAHASAHADGSRLGACRRRMPTAHASAHANNSCGSDLGWREIPGGGFVGPAETGRHEIGRLYIGPISASPTAPSRHRRRNAYRADMDVPVLKN